MSKKVLIRKSHTNKKVLIRKQAGGGIMYTREVGGRGQGGLMQDLAAVRGGARGLNAQGQQSFIPGAQLGAAKPTGMQRLAAGANIAGRGLAAALTGLQTAYGLQGGNVGALGNIADTYAQQAQGLTRNNPTEAQQTQDMATRALQSTQAADAQRGMTTALRQAQRAGEAQSVPLPTATPASPAPATPPAGLPTPPVPAQTPQAAQPAAPAAPAPPIDPQLAAQMLLTMGQQPTLHPLGPQHSGAMPLAQPPTPVAGTPPVDNGLTPHQGLPVMMPQQQTHEQQRQQVAVKPPVATPYTQGSTENPFANPTGQKPTQPHMAGRQTVPGTAYGRVNPNTVRPDSIYGANFGVNQQGWGSSEPSYFGDDPSIKWRSFATTILNEFGDMLHKADPHTAGSVIMRVFLDKILRKRLL